MLMATKFYNEMLTIGQEYEKFIVDLFWERSRTKLTLTTTKEDQINIGETLEGYEIKNDRLFHKTGNLAIECFEKGNIGNLAWTKSGILRDDNTKHWIIGNYDLVWTIWKRDLFRIYKREFSDRLIINSTQTGKIFLLPTERADKIAWKKTTVKLI